MCSVSRKAQLKLRDTIRAELNHFTEWRSEAETIQRLNRILQGWSNSFHYGNCSRVFTFMCAGVAMRLWRKHARARGRYVYCTDKHLYERYNLWKMPTTAGWTRQP